MEARRVLINTSGSIADAAILRRARELGLNQQFSSSTIYTSRVWRLAAGPYAEGMIFGGPWIDISVPEAREFVRSPRTKMGFERGYAAGLMVDARIVGWELDHAESNGPSVRDAIAKMSGLTSSLGGKLATGRDHYTVTHRSRSGK
jgi:ABC-type branched-subunit amino acid transport system substrate-binding protein